MRLSFSHFVLVVLVVFLPASSPSVSNVTDDPRLFCPAVSQQTLDAHDAARTGVADGLDEATDGGLASLRPVDEALSYAEILDPDRQLEGSRSVGTIHDGSVERVVRLDDKGRAHEVIDNHRERNTQWGTAELVDAIERAGRRVADNHGGAPLQVGNLGFRDGGPIPWSSSHQAGRDADLAFYALDDDGQSVPTPGLVEFDDDGRAVDRDLTFDTARNWTLVRALVTDPDINVQWLFVSLGLKSMMLEHAVDIGEPRDLVEQAADVLHQPTDAPPHADHLHLRIGCSQTDRLEGCVDWGPRWEFYDWHDDALFARTRRLDRALREGDDQTRRRALEFLDTIHAPFGPELALQHGLDDPDSDVRAAAFDVLDELRIETPFGVRALVRRLDDRDRLTTDRLETLYGALATAAVPEAADVAVGRFVDQSLSDDERTMALESLRHRMKPDIVPRLADGLRDEPDPDLRAKAATQIRRITARSHDLDWDRPMTDEHRAALDQWEQWAADTDADRRELLLEMLEPYGVDHWEQLAAVDDLIAELRSVDDYERYNLNLVLSEWTGRWVPRDLADDGEAYAFWSSWWDRNRQRQLTDRDRPWQQD